MEKLIYTSENEALDETLKQMKFAEALTVMNSDFIEFVNKNFKANNHPIYFIWYYIRKNFTYKEDDPDELIKPGYITLLDLYGDCDDFSIFAKAILDILKIKSNYMILGYEKNNFSHVVVKVNGLVIDGTNKEFGVIYPGFKFQKIIRN